MGLSSTSCHCCSLRTLWKMGVHWLRRNQTKSQYTFSSLKPLLVCWMFTRNATVLVICWQLDWKGFLPDRWYLDVLPRMDQTPCFFPDPGIGICNGSWQPTDTLWGCFCFCSFFLPGNVFVCLCQPCAFLPSSLHFILLRTFHSYLCLLPFQFIIYLLNIRYVLCHMILKVDIYFG